MVNSYQRITQCLNVARQLYTRSLWSVGFWWLSLITDVGPAMQGWQEYFSLMVVLVHLFTPLVVQNSVTLSGGVYNENNQYRY